MNNITAYCLGNGAVKCDGCDRSDVWLELNKLPDVLRKTIQMSAKRIDDTQCILYGRPWYENNLDTNLKLC